MHVYSARIMLKWRKIKLFGVNEERKNSVAQHEIFNIISRDREILRNYGRFAYGSFRLRSVRLRLESIRLRLICQFAYVLKHVLQQLIHLLYVRSRSDPSRSIQFLERDS